MAYNYDGTKFNADIHCSTRMLVSGKKLIKEFRGLPEPPYIFSWLVCTLRLVFY